MTADLANTFMTAELAKTLMTAELANKQWRAGQAGNLVIFCFQSEGSFSFNVIERLKCECQHLQCHSLEEKHQTTNQH